MHETGDLCVSTYDGMVWAKDMHRGNEHAFFAGEPVLFLGTQSPKGTRMIRVLTTKGIGWIEYWKVVILLRADGEEVDLGEQGLNTGYIRGIIDKFTAGR